VVLLSYSQENLRFKKKRRRKEVTLGKLIIPENESKGFLYVDFPYCPSPTLILEF
jgi:hypothetical protein